MRMKLAAAGVAAAVVVGGGAGLLLFGSGGTSAKQTDKNPQPVDIITNVPAAAPTTTTVAPSLLVPKTTAPPATVKTTPSTATPVTVAPVQSTASPATAATIPSASTASIEDDNASAVVVAAVANAGVDGTSTGQKLGDHVRDTTVVANAIGISETDLITALKSGQSIAQVAAAHNVDVQKVIDALVAAAKDNIAAALKAGKITQAQADQANANVVQRVTNQVNTTNLCPGRGTGSGGPGPGPKPLQEAVSDTSVAAGAIGISETDLVTALKSGQSLAQIAAAHSVDVQKVIDALVADAKSEIAAAFSAGRITQAQADQLNANVVQHVTNRVNAVPPTGGGPRPPGGAPNHA